MTILMRKVAFPVMCALLGGVVPLVSGQVTAVPPGPEPKKDTRVEPTSWGHVYGRVYDAKTGLPIKGASILGYTDNGFEAKGKSVGASDALGQYHIQLILGRISHNFDVGRALLSSPIAILFGSATNTTKRVDVARVALSVRATGYKPFEGMVAARSMDAGKFRIDLQPVLLAPSHDAGASVSAKDWNAIRVLEARASPSVARPKEKVQFTVSIRAFSKELAQSTQVSAYSALWKGAKKLKPDKELGADGTARFVGDYQVSGKEKQRANPIYFQITKANVDYDAKQSSRFVLMQIVGVGDDQKHLEVRVSALEALRQQNTVAARDAFNSLVRSGSKEPFDWELAASLSMRLGDPSAAVEPYSNLWSLAPKDLAASERYLRALYGAGRDSEVIAKSDDMLKGVKDRDLPKRMSSASLGLMGLTLVRTGDLKRADEINEKLLKITASGLNAEVIEFRGKLRLAEVEKAHVSNPSSPVALADYGRALLDLGRFEEAVAKLAESANLDPGQAAIQRDLAWAALQMQGGKKPVVDLDGAVADARNLLGLEKGQQRSKDFFAWNQYGILMFALADQKRSSGSADAAEHRDQAIEALKEALTLGRTGAKRNPGFYAGFQFGYMTGSEVAISGFAYPQANATFLLLDALRKLRRDEADRIGLLYASSALLDLGQVTLAGTYVSRLLAVDDGNVEGKFMEALVKYRSDDLEGAVLSLRRTLEITPNHPRANLVLADILTELGDPVGATERISQHASHYGEVERD